MKYSLTALLVAFFLFSDISSYGATTASSDMTAKATIRSALQMKVSSEGRAATGEVTHIQNLGPNNFLIDFGQPLPTVPTVSNGRIFLDRDNQMYYLIADIALELFGSQIQGMDLVVTPAPKGTAGYDALMFSRSGAGLPDRTLVRGNPNIVERYPAGARTTQLSVAFGIRFQNSEQELRDAISISLE